MYDVFFVGEMFILEATTEGPVTDVEVRLLNTTFKTELDAAASDQ